MLAEYFTKKVLSGGNFPFLLKIIITLIVIKRNLLLKKYGNFDKYKNIEGLEKYYINDDSFLFDKRKNGISLFARLKNSADFLEIAIESHIDFYDEIILVDNNSIDNTREICRKMEKKYPQKIKFYEYNENVISYGDTKRMEIPENSVHSMVYYYNWTLSKTTYKYVAKLDDDIIVLDKKLIEEKTNYIRKIGINYLQIIPQINIHISNGKLVTPISGPNSSILPLIAGIYCDHGIFPISEKTYFIKDTQVESFIFPFGFRVSKIGFFHLKGLKKKLGAFNQKGEVAKIIMEVNDNSKYIPLPIIYKEKLSNIINIKDYE